ncbi:MAG: hypothetical protein V4534_03470 [Myxococcota bacterium]
MIRFFCFQILLNFSLFAEEHSFTSKSISYNLNPDLSQNTELHVSNLLLAEEDQVGVATGLFVALGLEPISYRPVGNIIYICVGRQSVEAAIALDRRIRVNFKKMTYEICAERQGNTRKSVAIQIAKPRVENPQRVQLPAKEIPFAVKAVSRRSWAPVTEEEIDKMTEVRMTNLPANIDIGNELILQKLNGVFFALGIETIHFRICRGSLIVAFARSDVEKVLALNGRIKINMLKKTFVLENSSEDNLGIELIHSPLRLLEVMSPSGPPHFPGPVGPDNFGGAAADDDKPDAVQNPVIETPISVSNQSNRSWAPRSGPYWHNPYAAMPRNRPYDDGDGAAQR